MTCSSLRLKIAAAAMLVNLCPPLTAQAQTPAGTSSSEFLKKARASIVVLTGEDKAGLPVAPGLGFWIGENLIATDNRVVQSAVRLHVTVPGKESDPMEVTSRGSYRFATILTVTKTQAAALPLGEGDKVVVNDKVYIFADSASQSSASETSIGKVVIFNGGRYFQVAIPMSSASRGGPVLNSKGEVIGIAGECLDGLNETFVIPSTYLTLAIRYRDSEKAGGGMGSGGGMGPAQGTTGPGQGSGVADGNAQSGGQQPVDTKPVMLKLPQPLYTEEARKNHTQGVVAMRILVGEDGDVKRASIITGLPDGLNERALAAVYQMKFKPAMRNGVAVTYWLRIQVEFYLK